MNSRFRLFVILLALALILPGTPRAQDQGDGTLHVLRPSLNADQETAELCLEFDHALDLSDRRRLLASVKLESEGKPVPVTPTNASLAATSLCLQSLMHRRDYRLTIADLRGANNEKLTGPYQLSFTVPDRRPGLAFSGDPGAGLARYRDSDPVLRAVNVARARITLYRIADPARMAEAFRQRKETALAPSESLYFARDKGQLVWQGELVFDDSEDRKFANQSVERPVPLRAAAGALAPGLYFVAAEDAAPPVKAKPVAAGLAPLAAQWFLRSNLNIGVVRKDDGFFVTAGNTETLTLVKDARLLLLDRDQKVLAESRSDADGLGFLPVADDKRGSVSVIAGITDAGDADFASAVSGEGTGEPQSRFTLPDLNAALEADRPFYQPGDMINLTLTVRNVHDEAVAAPGSLVQLLRPDRSLYAGMPVPDGKAGVYSVSFAAPAMEGNWPVLWQQPDGRVLAQAPLRVTTNRKAPHIEATADRSALDDGGEVALSLKSVADDGAPAPYVAGHVLAQWTEPEALAGWDEYHFGDSESRNNPAAPVAAFITDARGTARLHISLKPPNDPAPLHAAVIRIQPDPTSGAFEPDPLSLPVKPSNYVIGIKSSALEGKFAENSVARFEVIALDGKDKRRPVDDLQYQVYEEGRSFAWYQTEGRWEYKLLQQRRRAGGGALSIRADDSATIRWPVTAGAYTLEITDTNGNLLARAHFDAGWGLLMSDKTESTGLALTSTATEVEPGVAAKTGFKLDRPALVTAVIADDRVRKVLHRTAVAGDNEITFTPEEDWGNRIRIHVKAEMAADQGIPPLAGDMELAVRHNPEELALATAAPDRLAAGQNLTLAVAVGKIAARQKAFVSVIATPSQEAGDGDATPAPASVIVRDVETDDSGKANIPLTVPVFSGDLHLRIIASNQNQWGHKELSIPVRPPFEADLPDFPVMQNGDTAHAALTLKDYDAPADTYHYKLSATPGLKVAGADAGKMEFAPGAGKTVFFDLTARQDGAGEIRLDMADSRGFHMSRSWPFAVTGGNWVFANESEQQIGPQQTWSSLSGGKPAADKKSAKAKPPQPSLVFAGPAPLLGAPAILRVLINSAPFTASEMAAWLEAARLWRDVIVEAGLLPQSVLEIRQKEILRRLLVRQNPDGGFSVLPGGGSDMTSTADALTALARADPAIAKPALDAASGWLLQGLANSWFDEKERAPRAAAFAALAAAGRLDVSALRYFAETSDGKPLPPLAAAQLASALAASGDQDKAAGWLKTIHDQDAPALWAALAENPLFDARSLRPALQKFSDDFARHQPQDPQELAGFLRALGALDARSGWRAAINGDEKDHKGLLVLRLPEKAAPLNIHNVTDQPLFIEQDVKTDMPPQTAPAGAVTRRIYRLDGSEASPGELKQGENYLVMLEAPWPAKIAPGDRLYIHDAPTGDLRVLSCALDSAAGSAESWAWIGSLSLSPVAACEGSAHDIGTVIAAPAAGNEGLWRVGYLAQVLQPGVFHLAPAPARELGGDEWIAGASQQIDVR